MSESLANNVSMSPAEFSDLKETIVNKFMSEYKGERITAEGEPVADIQVGVDNMQL